MLHGTEDFAITRRFSKIIHVTGNTYKTPLWAPPGFEAPIIEAPGPLAPMFNLPDLPIPDVDFIDQAINALLRDDPLDNIDVQDIWKSLPDLGGEFNFDAVFDSN